MRKIKIQTGQKINFADKSFIAFILFFLLAAVITYILYAYTSSLLKERLQERLLAISSTAALQFDAEDIKVVRNINDKNSTAANRLANKLNMLRSANDDIRYAYIMRRTSVPNLMEFVIDADTFASIDEIDENQNGIIDESEEVPQPGDPYDATDYPALRDEAFYQPAVDSELQPDQWGWIMASYAPIRDSNGDVVAILGIDVLIDDFNQRTQETFLPFFLFIISLFLILCLLTVILVRMWNERVEVVKEVDRQKDELLSIVSHQLATPVSSIKWYIEMLKDGDLGKVSKKQEEHLESISGIATNLSDLVSMILDVSRIQLGRMKIEKCELDLSQLLQQVVTMVTPKAKERNVRLITNFPDKFPKVFLDKRSTRIIFENLLTNAIKYSHDGGKVTFDVTIRKGKMAAKIKDQGCGIPSGEKDKIFSKLFRASNVRNNIEGNGFGLFIVKGATVAQGGQITFQSEEGVGTEFCVKIPITKISSKHQ